MQVERHLYTLAIYVAWFSVVPKCVPGLILGKKSRFPDQN